MIKNPKERANMEKLLKHPWLKDALRHRQTWVEEIATIEKAMKEH